MKKPKPFTIEKKLVAQVKYYETFFMIRDERGHMIFTGDEASATRILKLLEADAKKKVSR